MSDDGKQQGVSVVQGRPRTHDEERWRHHGFVAGLTAYAKSKGDPTLKRDNELLRQLADKDGWETIEAYERMGEPVLMRRFRCRLKNGHFALEGVLWSWGGMTVAGYRAADEVVTYYNADEFHGLYEIMEWID